MKFNSLGYFILDALKSIKRNKTITFASVVTVFVTFIVFGTFTLIALNFNKSIKDVSSQVEMKVYLFDDIKPVEKREIELKLSELEGVEDVVFESKEDAFKNFKEIMSESEGLLQGYDLDNNPLPSAFIVKLTDPKFAEPVAKSVQGMAGVEDIGNQQDLIDTIASFVKYVQIGGIVLFVVFIGVSIFLIMNTIKLTVYSRRREIGIMKFVGATDWFIRWPFMIEGIIIGGIGSILATAILYVGYKALFTFISTRMLLVTMVAPAFVGTVLIWVFILGGIIIGAVGSSVALRKFLDV